MSADKKLEGIPGAAPAPEQIAETETDEQKLTRLQQESQQDGNKKKLAEWRRRSGLTLADEKDGPFLNDLLPDAEDVGQKVTLYGNSAELAEDVSRQPRHWHQQPARPQVLNRFLQGTD